MKSQTLLFFTVASMGWTVPVLAHQVQTHESVGATLHIEPDDGPKAGTPSEVWFALTQAGGTVIPLAQCDCSLTLYDSSQQAIATPTLTPTSAEGFQGIPSTQVMFPEVGAYELVLAGRPTAGSAFEPFELRYDVTVAQRATAAPPIADPVVGATAEATPAELSPMPTPASETSVVFPSSWGWKRLISWAAAVFGVGVVWGVVNSVRSRGGKS
jgi:hypothetical protein